MQHYQIYRKFKDQWVLIRTRLESLEMARKVLSESMAESPEFGYRICMVSVAVVEEIGAGK